MTSWTRTWSLWCASLIVASASAASTFPQPIVSPEQAGRWAVLSAHSIVPTIVTWNPHTGAPRTLFGKFVPPPGSSREESARSFLRENAELLRLSAEPTNLTLQRQIRSPMGTHVVFQQVVSGVPVWNARVKVHLDRSGNVVGINDGFRPGIRIDSTTPRISAKDAIRVVISRIPARSILPSDDPRTQLARGTALVIDGDAGSGRLAWRVVARTKRETWEGLVDAVTGVLLRPLRDINQYATGLGQVFRDNAIVATRDTSLKDDNDAASAVPDSAYETVVLQDLTGNGYLDGKYASGRLTLNRAFSSDEQFIYDRSSDKFSETMAYYYMDYAERYIQSLGFSDVDNRQIVFSVNRSQIDNSYYGAGQIDLGTGGVDDAEDAEVILHEYGHSIQDDQVPGFGAGGEATAMGEGFADYWAASVTAQISGGFQDLCLGEWDAASWGLPCVRRLDSSKHYPEDFTGGDPHEDGEIWSAALWQIREAIGATRADTLILTSNFLLSVDDFYSDGANALVVAATNLGYSSQDIETIRTILNDRGLFSPPPPMGGIHLASGQTSPTNRQPIVFTVKFTRPACCLSSSSFVLNDEFGSPGGTVSVSDSGDHKLYDAAVSGLSKDGCISLSLPVGAVTYDDGSTSAALRGPTVCLDTVPPRLTMNSVSPPWQTWTNVSPIVFEVITSKQLPAGGFPDASVSLSGTAGTSSAVVKGPHQEEPWDPIRYYILVSGMRGDGTVTATIPVDAVHDYAGNGNPSAVTATMTYTTATATLYQGEQMLRMGESLNLVAITQGVNLADGTCLPYNVDDIHYDLDVDPTTGALGDYALGTATSWWPLTTSTSGWKERRYILTATFPGAVAPTTIQANGWRFPGIASCGPSEDRIALTVGEPGFFAHGEGAVVLADESNASLAFDVYQPPEGGGVSGEIHLVRKGEWKLDGTLSSYLHAGSDGAAQGVGTVTYWDATADGGRGNWSPYSSWVSFTASFRDGTGPGRKPADFGLRDDWRVLTNSLATLPAPLLFGQIEVR